MTGQSEDPDKPLVPIPREPDEPFVAGATYFSPLPTRGVDKVTFQILNALYARDAKMVYYRYGKVPKADPVSFRVLDPGFYREPVEYSLDYPDSHGLPHFQGYARDDQNVFHYVDTIGQPSAIRGVDLDTFETILWGYARDKNHIYHERTRLKGARPDDFRQLNPYFSITRNAVYYRDQKIVGADPGSFRILRNALAVDKSHVYLYQRTIEGADPTSFEAVGISFIGKDRHRAYAHWEPIEGVDVETFVNVGGCYQTDKNRVYYQGKPISGADPETFRFIKENWGEDKIRAYNAGYPARKPWKYRNE